MPPQTTETPNPAVDEGQARITTIKPALTTAGAPEQGPPNRNDGQLGERIREFCNWAFNIAVLAAAIVFGIWAPLSYNVTLVGNNGNDESSKSMLSAMQAASAQASVVASKQSTMLNAMDDRIGAIGQLRLVEFCATQTTVSACQAFVSEIDLPSLITYLASTTITPTSSSSRSTITQASSSFSTSAVATPAGSSQASRPSVHLSVPAILGIVFGGLVAIGWLIGAYLFLSRRHRRADKVET
ncbi:hypothetical protein BP6252_14094 [Coleophoma cylindrospora]|uniref:Uncharacterized protein n=1 Tax=Coleophoma cylindrospora TaxID=1849047 RepID=A0A3D8Q3Y4_9HELO|nr:hypothetical protein BP6252_14094 [Coleophoma cylindrospora]